MELFAYLAECYALMTLAFEVLGFGFLLTANRFVGELYAGAVTLIVTPKGAAVYIASWVVAVGVALYYDQDATAAYFVLAWIFQAMNVYLTWARNDERAESV